MSASPIGTPTNRVDGPAKVTGGAQYAADHPISDLAYGFVVSAAVARGRIVRVDEAAARKVPGVLKIFTHENTRKLAGDDESWQDEVAPPGSPFRPFQDPEVRFSAQPVALVVADSPEAARYAASLVRVEYAPAPHATDLLGHLKGAREPRPRGGMAGPTSRGDAEKALAGAAVRVEAEYLVPVEHHNPLELFAATALPGPDGGVTVYDKTQGARNVHGYLCKVFGLAEATVRVLSPFVGGAFGSGLRPQYHLPLAVLAALDLGRPVRVELTRQQMFTFGHRPVTWQRVALGASPEGRLEALLHEALSETSRFEDYSETVVDWSGVLYRCENVKLARKVVGLDLPTPNDMRAPGAVWGLFALESAMDELAARLGVDPIELRLRNYAETDQSEGKPFSSKELRACYREGAERFGWARRNPLPRSMREGAALVGWGMAGGIWEAYQLPAAARAVLTADGELTVASATADIGPGTYTVMTQIAAGTLGLPVENVRFRLGDSSLPFAPVEGGSWTTSSVGSAVKLACERLQERLFRFAGGFEGSPLSGLTRADVLFEGGRLRSKADPSRSVTLAEAMRRGGAAVLEEEATAEPSEEQEKYSRYVHSAIFAEVKVDADFGTVRATRVVSAVAGGRVLNPKTARSQVLGGIVMGLGTALQEESVLDHAFGRFVNHNLAEYHIPVCADAPDVEVLFVEEKDEVVNSLGAKGLGEIGIVGVAAAVANAVFHATGKRIRELPITPDKLI
ncbi:MAG: xanthine dehydrogenase family protein molybdopterin-binding subunit [Deltaproteobacteria bacterium]|nr:xanthine dehydrogenase family protein molybdopterin-binding subunit [Deltaproteobacteria bacterium]